MVELYFVIAKVFSAMLTSVVIPAHNPKLGLERNISLLDA